MEPYGIHDDDDDDVMIMMMIKMYGESTS